MIKNILHSNVVEAISTVAVFGQSKLVRTGWNKLEIRGGSPDEQDEAREWVSIFLHGCLIDSTQHGTD